MIEKDIPLPTPRRKKYVFADMVAGDSVFMEGEHIEGVGYSAARMHGKRFGKRFTARTVDGGVRIWRVS